MANMKLLAVAVMLALLQVLSLQAHFVSGAAAAGKQHGHPKPGTNGTSTGNCHSSGFLQGTTHKCNTEHGSDCCVAGRKYAQFRCSPPVSDRTPAMLTLNSFAKGGDGGAPSFCDNRYHADTERVVALSSGWLRLDGTRRCGKTVRVSAANGRSVLAKVVDECDSVNGCDSDHNFEPPCPNDVVDGSPAVWKALGLDQDKGLDQVTWSDV